MGQCSEAHGRHADTTLGIEFVDGDRVDPARWLPLEATSGCLERQAVGVADRRAPVLSIFVFASREAKDNLDGDGGTGFKFMVITYVLSSVTTDCSVDRTDDGALREC